MKNAMYAKNGQLVSAIKTLAEMTSEEKAKIRPVDEGRFNAYHVQYNKAGKLLHVSGAGLMKTTDEDHKADLMDGLQVLYNDHKHSKAYQSAKKHLGVSNEQINRARQIVRK